jgi:D-glycero-D-manno-heptose 1,7-bisphosphate phosphatase
MSAELAAVGAHVDAYYYCPHHPEAGTAPYRQVCDCRKPAPGMITKAISEWPVDVERSFIIGDRDSDLKAGQAAGLVGHHFVGGNLADFVSGIISARTTSVTVLRGENRF